MTTMLEKMARAMCAKESGDWDARSCMETLGGSEPEDMRQGYIDLARAALQAIRKPSEALIEAHMSSMEYGYGAHEHVWTDTIDAILAEDKP